MQSLLAVVRWERPSAASRRRYLAVCLVFALSWLPYMVGVSTLPEIMKQLASSHLRLMPMRLASGNVNA